MTLVAIHQPNFLPWLGYFDKVSKAQVFIALDDVQFQKTGATWTNRVQLLIGGAPSWITVPLVRAFHGTRTIAEVEINETSPWRGKLLRTVELNYKRAGHFGDVMPWLTGLISLETTSLLEYNMHAIRAIATAVGLDPGRIVLSSDARVGGAATERLIALVRAVGGDGYLAGGGAEGYQDDSLFGEAGVALVYQRFEHPTYPQHGARQFTPGLSIVDALMNCGFDGTADLVHRGIPA